MAVFSEDPMGLAKKKEAPSDKERRFPVREHECPECGYSERLPLDETEHCCNRCAESGKKSVLSIKKTRIRMFECLRCGYSRALELNREVHTCPRCSSGDMQVPLTTMRSTAIGAVPFLAAKGKHSERAEIPLSWIKIDAQPEAASIIILSSVSLSGNDVRESVPVEKESRPSNGYDSSVFLPENIRRWIDHKPLKPSPDPWELHLVPDDEDESFCPSWRFYGRKSRTDKDFWRLISRGNRNECWSWKGSFARGTPIYSAYGRTRSAMRHGWGLIHGYLPEDQEIRHACFNKSCMNPRHWCLGGERETGHWASAQLSEQEINRLRRLHFSGAYPLRVLASTFGLDENEAWALVGLTKKRIEEKGTQEVYYAQLEEEREGERFEKKSLAMDEKLVREQARKNAKDERAAKTAELQEQENKLRGKPYFWCDHCYQYVIPDGLTEVEVEGADQSGLSLLCATVMLCSSCHRHWRSYTRKFSITFGSYFAQHVRSGHKASIVISSRPASKVRSGGSCLYGMSLAIKGRCDCGDTMESDDYLWGSDTSKNDLD